MVQARQLAEDRMREICEMPVDALARFVDEPVETEVKGPSGGRYRLTTSSFWDDEPERSDLFTRVKVTGRGIRGFQRYYGVEVRNPETEFAKGDSDEVLVSPTWTEIGAWVLFALVVLVFIAPWFVGVGYLVSRIL